MTIRQLCGGSPSALDRSRLRPTCRSKLQSSLRNPAATGYRGQDDDALPVNFEDSLAASRPLPRTPMPKRIKEAPSRPSVICRSSSFSLLLSPTVTCAEDIRLVGLGQLPISVPFTPSSLRHAIAIAGTLQVGLTLYMTPCTANLHIAVLPHLALATRERHSTSSRSIPC
ncbi:hypothetical protein N657DRAFT_261696 [Parathielavia appendiculata]|uniref:Uncharacterized protein n=1 Tax=Parathielavia appendiculata TaxID=2587402 RepID=A0AAN6TRW6_9PEZI|nr:hypothetical protein N657DRAFT_261696 [Parathielavia appendiculata]